MISVNGVRGVSCRVVTPWRGVWSAEIDVDPETVALVPTSGPAVVTIGAPPQPVTVLTGTVDPRGSGSFTSTGKVRVVGGGGGWDHLVPSQYFASDGGVPASLVMTSTAALVGEIATVVDPTIYVEGYARTAGPARRVLDGFEWHVDPTGVTQVGPRLPALPDPSTVLLEWSPKEQRASLASDALVLPNTTIVDTRLPGPIVVRDVEQVFGPSGSHVNAWCAAAPTPRIVDALRSAVREFARVDGLRIYRYRIVLQSGDGRLALQAIAPSAGAPDLVPVHVWPGMQGDSAKVLVGSEVLVAFAAGDLSQPRVIAFDDRAVPLERTIDATIATHVGPSAALVQLAGGAAPLVMAGPYAQLLTALATFASAMAAAAAPGSPLSPLAAVAGNLSSALGALPPAATTKTVAA